MDLDFTLWLLLAMFIVSPADTSNIDSYIPQVTLQSIPGKRTASTFVLDQPQCVFDKTPTANVWLVIATSQESFTLSDQALKTPITYSKSAGYYHIKPLSENVQFPCTDIFRYIRVGNEPTCPDPALYCNGPLKSSETYRVKFVEIDGTTLKNQTKWSPEIKLLTATNPSNINTWPGGRSGGMIVLTSILSVLMAFLLAGLVAAVIVGCKGISSPPPVVQEKVPLPEGFDMRSYVTHLSPSEVSD